MKFQSKINMTMFAMRVFSFTPLESPSIYAGDGGNRKHQLLIEGRVKTLPFLMGFTSGYLFRQYGYQILSLSMRRVVLSSGWEGRP